MESDAGTASTAPAGRDIRLVAVDLDGTLLDPQKRVDDETAAAIRQLAEGGFPVVIASARPPRSVRPTYQQLGLRTLQINYNGALIWDESRRAAVLHRPMKAELVRRIVAACRDLFEEVQVSCEILDRWYTDRYDPAHTTETGRMFQPDVISPLERFAHLDVTKLMLLGEPWMMLRLENLIAAAFEDEVTVVRTDDDLLQVMDKRVSKARAVQQVARHYGVEMSQVLAIGDAPNDYGMVATAGVGVAMGNAHALVKEVADFIAPPNDRQGVLVALRHFGLVR
ncbi:MAG: Cof-type HAD-IIB family hydrolase [Tepidisphaerales bacterium]